MKNICIHNTGNGYCMAFDRPCNNESCNEYCAEYETKKENMNEIQNRRQV